MSADNLFHISPDADLVVPLLSPGRNSTLSRELNRNYSTQSFISENFREHSSRKTIVLLLKSFIGTGVLFLPKSFYDAGLIPAIFSMIFTAALSFYGVKILLKLTLISPGSYWQIANEVGGPKMKNFVVIMLFLLQCGLVMAYTSFVAFNFTSLLFQYFDYSIDPLWFIILIAVTMIPVCFTSKLKNFSIIASLGNIFILVTLAAVVGYSFREIATTPKDILYFGKWNNTLKFMGTCKFILI
eukprot:NODE_7_length_67686_cov_1.621421.p30 type:complete len:242 gc:universal NODE_7_length_67686_cov_1.621421:13309-14034(+)